MRFATRSSTRAAALIAAVAGAAVLAVLGIALGLGWLAFGGLGAAILAAAALALYLIVSERRRHEVAEEELSAEARFLESLVESMRAIAATLDADEILQLLADGMSNADVASKLFISQETVKSHVRHILTKLEADTRTHAVAIALREAIID